LKKLQLLVIFTLLFESSFSQNTFEDAYYIKTVIFKSNVTNTYTPIIKLNEQLFFSFDDLNADERTYYYKIEHCNVDWTSSNLSTIEYIDGFPEYKITNYQNSFNTYLPYTNYELKLPNINTKIKISGNYILSIYNDSQEIVLKRKFIVYEPKVIVAVTAHKSRDISKIDTHQNINFTINTQNLRINNPGEEIMPILLQNNNWQTAIIGLKPQFYKGNQLIYQYSKETTYWAGNEFLYFDTKAIREANLYIARSELGEDIYHTYLYTNEERKNVPYTLFPDINGNFYIRTLYGDSPNIDADYSWVHFYLDSLENFEGKEIYVSGNFNDWALNNSNKMIYNNKTNLYEATILLKQGFYNYQFLTKDKQGNLSNYDIDGSFYQTENDYTVLVYYRAFGTRYTQVIGYGLGNSRILLN
jgi:hypothetical protein